MWWVVGVGDRVCGAAWGVVAAVGWLAAWGPFVRDWGAGVGVWEVCLRGQKLVFGVRGVGPWCWLAHCLAPLRLGSGFSGQG